MQAPQPNHVIVFLSTGRQFQARVLPIASGPCASAITMIKCVRLCVVLLLHVRKTELLNCFLATGANSRNVNDLCVTALWTERCVLLACLSSGVSTWKVRSMTVVHCRQRMINVLGLGRSVFISWHSDHSQGGREVRGMARRASVWGSRGKRQTHSYSHLSLSPP